MKHVPTTNSPYSQPVYAYPTLLCVFGIRMDLLAGTGSWQDAHELIAF
jgi:hypothetical protein